MIFYKPINQLSNFFSICPMWWRGQLILDWSCLIHIWCIAKEACCSVITFLPKLYLFIYLYLYTFELVGWQELGWMTGAKSIKHQVVHTDLLNKCSIFNHEWTNSLWEIVVRTVLCNTCCLLIMSIGDFHSSVSKCWTSP